MFDHQQNLPISLPVGIIEAGKRLALEVGILAGRLAKLLDDSMLGIEGPIREGRNFLWETYVAVAEGRELVEWERGPLARKPADSRQPLDRLEESLALCREEIELLLLAGMSEAHEGMASVFATLHPCGDPRVSVGLATQLLCQRTGQRLAFRRILESSRVIASGAVQITGNGPLFYRSLHIADSLWSVLHGIDAWPASISRLPSSATTAGLEEWLEGSESTRAILVMRQQLPCTVLVTGDSEDIAFQRALALVKRAFAVPMGISLSKTLDTQLERLIQVHALARGNVPVLRLEESEGVGRQKFTNFGEFPRPVVVCGQAGKVSFQSRRPIVSVRVEPLSSHSRLRMWRESIPELAEDAPHLAARYIVEPADAAKVCSDLRFFLSLERQQPTLEDIATGIRTRSSCSLSGGVKLLRPRATFKNLVLPQDRLSQLREAMQRLELQGRVFDDWGFLKESTGARGVRMLFSGPSGTGKTLSAEVLAHEMSVDLLVVDISQVVSKWIGETEKNLAEVFDVAERAQAVLFFDEADALFGKRTEVSDAHDRYANLETAYLLTRLERFEGLAILATNFRQNIDSAFLRRLEFILEFDEPDCEERVALWKCHVPTNAPMEEDVNFYELASIYPVVGGIIRNAAVAAGFLAAADGTSMTRHHFIHAIRREYEKIGRAFPGVPAGVML